MLILLVAPGLGEVGPTAQQVELAKEKRSVVAATAIRGLAARKEEGARPTLQTLLCTAMSILTLETFYRYQPYLARFELRSREDKSKAGMTESDPAPDKGAGK